MQLFRSLFTFLMILALLVLGIWFTLRNQQQVPLDLLFIRLPENSLALWLILSLIAGVLLGSLLMLPWLTRCKARILQQERQLKLQKEELHKLRTLTLKSPD
ncbi:LapA family protein [Marinospirillum alkaliphilum]|uniref:Lipopolysaccharide assembly protein A domain-containing protein n=1 Tax=Marinospirillum alkaliphilum DSM 21637 TaxID=1122209 RepID=A0A1K1YJY0_9GAMM|nr:LapA family protein [Marinospirillum alkaliphilum]SFX62111.1 Protein of unknown function [Marinospirillum alkaliphilum DSM 21637]